MKLIGSIISKNLVEAEQAFIKKMAVIVEAKLEEKKKMISAVLSEKAKDKKKDEEEEEEDKPKIIKNIKKKVSTKDRNTALIRYLAKKKYQDEKRKGKVNEQRMLPSGEVEMPSGEVIPQSLAKQRRGLAEKET